MEWSLPLLVDSIDKLVILTNYLICQICQDKSSIHNTKEPNKIVYKLWNTNQSIWKLNTNHSIGQWWQHEEWFGYLSLLEGTHSVSLVCISYRGNGKSPFYHKEKPRREAFPLHCCSSLGVLHAFQQCTCTCQHFQSMLLHGVAYSLDHLASIEGFVFPIPFCSIQLIQLDS